MVVHEALAVAGPKVPFNQVIENVEEQRLVLIIEKKSAYARILERSDDTVFLGILLVVILPWGGITRLFLKWQAMIPVLYTVSHELASDFENPILIGALLLTTTATVRKRCLPATIFLLASLIFPLPS